ncbi:MAG: transposase, partial [Oscillospiraceae bacterium]
MIERQQNNRRAPALTDIDSLVPRFHLLRKIERSMDWDTVYALVEHLYSKNVGRPSVDPVVLIKIVLLQHLYGHRSLRETVRVCEDSVSYRWFLGYGLLDTIPHFSTVSYNFLHRFGSDVFEQIFNMVLEQAIDSGYIKPDV